MLPEGWRTCALGDIARISSGGTPSRAESGYWDGDIPWVTTGEIHFNTITDTVERITAAGLKNSSARLYPPNTLLMAMYGQGKTRGQVAKLGIEAATNQACAAIVLNAPHDPDFYFQYLSSEYEAIRKLGNAGTQRNLNAGILKDLVVPVPPPQEQLRIVRLLSAWDRAIDVAERLLVNSRRQREILLRALMSGARRFHTEGPWVKRTIGDLIVESRVVGSGGHAARKLTVKLYGRGVVSKLEKRAGSESTQYYRRSAGQFIYSKLDFLNGAFGRIPQALDGFESTLDLPAFDFKVDRVDPQWFLHHVCREDFYLSHLGLAHGGRKARRVNPSDLMRVEIAVPDLKEQRTIAKTIDAAIALERSLARQSDLLRRQKDVLMNELLQGIRRTSRPDAT